METSEDRTLLRNNPLFVIFIASLLALAMFAFSFTLYYRSDTKKTIEQIQANNLLDNSQTSTESQLPSELNSDYLDSLERSITELVNSHSDESEFNPDELTDSALGL